MLTVKFGKLSSDGSFVGEVLEGDKKGKKVFARFVAPGEIILIEPVQEKDKYIFGVAREIVSEYSKERVTPKCKHFGVCGGCDLQFLSISEQRRAKLEMVRDLFSTKLKISKPEQIQMYGGELPEYHYRNRVRLQVSRDGKVGFFEAGSHEVVEIKDCPIVEEKIAEVIRWCSTETAYCEQIELSLKQDGEINLVPIKGKFKPISKTPLGVNILSYKKTPSYDLFSQVNKKANQALVNFVVKNIQGISITEFYAGSGNFSFPLHYAGKKVVAVESSRELVERASGKGIKFICSLAERYARQNTIEGSVLLDPPRGGAKECVEVFSEKVDEVVYVSCNPATLGRDIEILQKKGLSLELVTLFDMFPQTAHIEAVGVLRR